MMNRSLILISVFFFCYASVTAEKSVDILIIQNYKSLKILNRYEQSVSPFERRIFLPYSPLEIINKNVLLSDQITSGLSFRLQNKTFYILKNEDGTFAGNNPGNYKRSFRNCKLINDTIRISKSGVILFSERHPSSGRREYLKNNELLIRQFKYNNYYYLKRINKEIKYGWARLPYVKWWEKHTKSGKQKTTLTDYNISNRLIERIEKANRLYRQYFEYFNKKTGENKPVPEWQIQKKDKILKCFLKGDYNPVQLSQSTDYLVHDLKNILIGKPFNVEYNDRTIIISPEQD